jgi:hypothetical protein
MRINRWRLNTGCCSRTDPGALVGSLNRDDTQPVLSVVTAIAQHAVDVAMRDRRSASRSVHRPPGRRRVWRWTAGIVAFAVLVAAVAWHDQVSGSTGYATWQDRTTTMLRQVGLGGLLDQFQNWRYARSTPPDTPPLPRTSDNADWHPVIRVPGMAPSVYTAVIQPDPSHRSVVAGVAMVRSAGTRAHLMAGTTQPAPSRSPGRIPPAELPSVVAAFNSGPKMSARPGGFFLDGTTVHELRNGKASAVIDDRGHLTVGQWGRDVQMNAHVVAVRQNRDLIVDNGRPEPGLDRNRAQRWGRARTQSQYTWRSGMGTTAHGDVVYVAGDKLSLPSLAAALVQAGAVRGMELDIHGGMEFFSSWQNNGAGAPKPQRLVPTMAGPDDRYIRPEQRDFFYFTAATPSP